MSSSARFMTSFISRIVTHYWGVIGIIAAWQAWVSITGVNSIVMPHPWDVVADVIHNPGIYWQNGIQTLLLAAGGLLLGMALGTLIAVAAWTSRFLSGVLVPLGLMFSSIPVVSLIPVLARLLGYDVKTVLAIVVIISFFPAFVFTAAGLRGAPPGSDDLFKVLGASGWRRFIHLIVPSAVPHWMIALRIAAPPAILAAMVAEFLMGMSGLGYLFRTAATDFDTARAFGTSAVATVISVVCFSAATAAEARVNARWR